MSRRGKLIAVMACAALFAGRCAFGATIVSPVNGTVLVNQGKGFVEITADVEVRAGAKVMVRPGGSAMIYYGNNCSGEIGPGKVWVVRENVDCDMATGVVDGGGYVSSSEMAVGAMAMTIASGGAIAAAVTASDRVFTPPLPVSP